MKRIMTLIVFLIFIICLSNALAESKIFIKEYTYQASEDDSRNSSRTLALLEVKRLLLEELGTYLESVTEVKNFQLTKDQITTLTAGIVMTEIVDEKWDGHTYYLKAKITTDNSEIIKSIDALRKDYAKTRELEETRKRTDDLLKENEKLRKELLTAKGKDRQKKTASYNKTIENLNAIEWVEKGYAYIISGNANDAIVAFSKAIELNPKDAEAYNNRGAAYGILGDYNQAINDGNKAIELNPKYALAYYNRGVAYGRLGNYSQEINDYNKAIELNPKDAEAYNNRGTAYGKLGNHNQEINDYNKAIELNPKDAVAYYNRGIAYCKLGNYNQAINDGNKAIELNPKYADAYNNRGAAYDSLGDYNQAINEYNKAIELNPKYAVAYYNRGAIYFKLGNYNQAIKDCAQAIELTPQYANAYVLQGFAYDSLGNIDQAIKAEKIAARLGHPEAQDFLRKAGVDW